MLYSLQLLLYAVVLFVVLYLLLNCLIEGKKCVCIVVLGDIGRSPRMQYHALSFAREGYNVELVGYAGSEPHKDVQNNEKIEIYHLSPSPTWIAGLPRLLGYIAKTVWQSISLASALLLLAKSKYIMLQNPPSIPTIAMAWIACLLRRSCLVVDWHNYGYTILGLSLGYQHPLVKISKWYEGFFGRFSKINLCVTSAMKDDLRSNWGISAVTVYDRPPAMFKECPLAEQHDLFWRLGKEHSSVFSTEQSSDGSEETDFTLKLNNGKVQTKKIRPALLVSSTSWTEDEDFSILLKALQTYDEAARDGGMLPDLICVITGKGPQKALYQKKIQEIEWNCVKFCLPWLTAEDYPRLLGSADVGVCLHKSSSGLDLPMKVVDMFGCSLPVCAVQFNCLPELVQHGKNGLIFSDSSQLVEQLKTLLDSFPMKQKKLKEMRRNVKALCTDRWHDQWTKEVLPLFEQDIDMSKMETQAQEEDLQKDQQKSKDD